MTEIIKTDGTRQPVQPANGSDFTLEEMQGKYPFYYIFFRGIRKYMG